MHLPITDLEPGHIVSYFKHCPGNICADNERIVDPAVDEVSNCLLDPFQRVQRNGFILDSNLMRTRACIGSISDTQWPNLGSFQVRRLVLNIWHLGHIACILELSLLITSVFETTAVNMKIAMSIAIELRVAMLM